MRHGQDRKYSTQAHSKRRCHDTDARQGFRQGNASAKSAALEQKAGRVSLSDIDDIAVKSDKDGLSGAMIHHSVLHRRSGEITVLTTEEAKDAAATVKKLREFV